MRTQIKAKIRDLGDDQLIKRYKYLQSKDSTRGGRKSKYFLYYIRKRGLNANI